MSSVILTCPILPCHLWCTPGCILILPPLHFGHQWQPQRLADKCLIPRTQQQLTRTHKQVDHAKEREKTNCSGTSPSIPTCKRSDYLVGPQIGEGSFAVVHKGTEKHNLQRNVAIKIVRSEDELGLHGDGSGDCGVSYQDVLRSMRLEMQVSDV